VIAGKDSDRVRLYSRPGNDLTGRFPLIVGAVAGLRPRSCIIDGEAVACSADGIACFEMIRRWATDDSVFMWGFELIELNGERSAARSACRAQGNSSREFWISLAYASPFLNEHEFAKQAEAIGRLHAKA
jgi:hypothetical protein